MEVISVAHGDTGRQVDEQAASMLEALFTRSPIGLHLLDTDLRVVRVNTATPVMQGVSLSELRGRPLREVYDMADDDLEPLLREVLDTGVPLLQHIVPALIDGEPPRRRQFEVSAMRLAGHGESALGVAVTSVDVTERERTRSRATMREAVRDQVGRTLDPVVTGEELVSAVVPVFADIAIVEVVDAVLRGDDPPPAPLPTGTPMMRTAFRSGSADPPQAHRVGDIRRLPVPTPFTQTLTDLRPRLVELRATDSWLAHDPPVAEAIRSSGAHSLLAVPLVVRDAPLGVVSLYRTGDTPPFDEADRDLAAELAAHAALCVDNARHHMREHTIAAMVQRQLLPRRPETHASLESAYLSVTGTDPGAWYDTIALSGGRTALVVGSVSGRGLHAAATMGQLRTVIRSLAAFDLAPDELLARLYDTAGQLAAERSRLPLGDPSRREPLAAECVYAVHDPLTGTCTLASAGRLAPLLVSPDGSVALVDAPSGPRLGTTEGAPFATTDIKVPDGSVLVFTSDPLLTGYLAESPGPLPSAPDFCDRPIQDLCDALVYALPEGLGAGDAAVIVARTRAFPADRFVVWPLDPVPEAVREARRRTRRQLAEWRVDEDTAFNTLLIVSELVTNAVRYGSPPLELRLIRDRTLTCEVRDAGSAAPHLRHADTVDEGGRGLFITAQLAQAWGTRYTTQGKTVWTEQTQS
ncbi:GAF domain-containing protein/anti-sigma regulatory factor (Ser/Thr protein kinase) [Streptomyces sp. 3330]|uniref:SpoIIE family protein phosphatase n=1 Tax=Streptomyces sp. 3330 TaxID=2817755 RepID=UPI00285A4305|nr:SpoIIE family protein phosphatase [Streptomyces sp. 3330]MDR6975988.1 GAF domain-containing protein/anti-sigma regulatory factor (Ser/Thr protein kinase) [Streptomyces sp. 3330]